ncbi:MAG: 2-C-methyl-D-erythritol 4-phosphate cytidylyltransferase, partial [Gammaproteobacteria bacterium]|nr:2-C-methyl-D-erythritol 4-phosphate cytidylyltransferase [Gammaproteobacteria bacterium]
MSGAPAAKRVFAILPAAGRGERFAPGAAAPKQYAGLAGRTMLEWSLAALLDEPRIACTVV